LGELLQILQLTPAQNQKNLRLATAEDGDGVQQDVGEKIDESQSAEEESQVDLDEASEDVTPQVDSPQGARVDGDVVDEDQPNVILFVLLMFLFCVAQVYLFSLHRDF
jgi:hypothetical protein